MRGTIIKSLSGFYTVRLEDNSVHVCKARGKFRKDGIKPMVGDLVDIVPSNDNELGNIETVHERNNSMETSAGCKHRCVDYGYVGDVA